METRLAPLESAVLRSLYEEYVLDREALESQLRTVRVASRENTGAGFFTRLEVDRARSKPIGGQRFRQGPQATIPGLQHGMGFVLWLDAGYIATLEGYSYDESTGEIAFENATFELAKPRT